MGVPIFIVGSSQSNVPPYSETMPLITSAHGRDVSWNDLLRFRLSIRTLPDAAVSMTWPTPFSWNICVSCIVPQKRVSSLPSSSVPLTTTASCDSSVPFFPSESRPRRASLLWHPSFVSISMSSRLLMEKRLYTLMLPAVIILFLHRILSN